MSKSFSIPNLTAELTKLKKGDPADCIKKSLRAAIKLEFATIPPYLTAMWSIIDSNHDVARTLKEIVVEEMLHMGLACNMLVGLGESLDLATADSVPSYPGPLPGEVNPELEITLRRLAPSQIKVFMDIEYPEGGPITATAVGPFDTIGEFYAALLKAFEILDPTLDVSNQRDDMFGTNFHLFRIANLNDVRKAINLIRRQGEGSSTTPEETPGHLAHFYQFREVYVGAKYIFESCKWGHTGPPVLMPLLWPMADIPEGGYKEADVPPNVWQKIREFDVLFTTMLSQLDELWRDPTAQLSVPVISMYQLGPIAQGLMQMERDDRRGTYGPCFRFVK